MSSSSVELAPERLRLALRRPESTRALTTIQREWLRAALLDDPRTSIEDVLADIAGERAQLWQIAEGGDVLALIVTRIIDYDRGCALRVQACGGVGMHRWLPLLADLEHHARRLGCRWVEVQGRRGWERTLPGYAFQCVQLAKEL